MSDDYDFFDAFETAWDGFERGMNMGNEYQYQATKRDKLKDERDRIKNDKDYQDALSKAMTEWYVDPEDEMQLPNPTDAITPEKKADTSGAPASGAVAPPPPGLSAGGESADPRPSSSPSGSTPPPGAEQDPRKYWIEGEAKRYNQLAKIALNHGKVGDAQNFLKQRDRNIFADTVAQKDASKGLQFKNAADELHAFDMLSAGSDPESVLWAYNNQMPEQYEIESIQPSADGSEFQVTRKNGSTDTWSQQRMNALRQYVDRPVASAVKAAKNRRAASGGLNGGEYGADTEGLTPLQSNNEARSLREEIAKTDDWGAKLMLARKHDQMTGANTMQAAVSRDFEQKITSLRQRMSDRKNPAKAAAARQEYNLLSESVGNSSPIPGMEGSPGPQSLVKTPNKPLAGGGAGEAAPGQTPQGLVFTGGGDPGSDMVTKYKGVVSGPQANAVVKQLNRPDLPPPDPTMDVDAVEIKDPKTGRTKMISFDPRYLQNPNLHFTGRYRYVRRQGGGKQEPALSVPGGTDLNNNR